MKKYNYAYLQQEQTTVENYIFIYLSEVQKPNVRTLFKATDSLALSAVATIAAYDIWIKFAKKVQVWHEHKAAFLEIANQLFLKEDRKHVTLTFENFLKRLVEIPVNRIELEKFCCQTGNPCGVPCNGEENCVEHAVLVAEKIKAKFYTSPLLQEFFGKELTPEEENAGLAKMVQEVCDKNDAQKSEIDNLKQLAEHYRQNVGRSGEDYLLQIERHKNHIAVLKDSDEKQIEQICEFSDTINKQNSELVKLKQAYIQIQNEVIQLSEYITSKRGKDFNQQQLESFFIAIMNTLIQIHKSHPKL